MITLKTLSKATVHEVWGQVARHLLTQKQRSVREDAVTTCAYRGRDGLKCAAGCLIADDEYSPGMEYSNWCFLVGSKQVPDAHSDLINALQDLHDEIAPEKWRDELVRVAINHGVSYAEIKAVMDEHPSKHKVAVRVMTDQLENIEARVNSALQSSDVAELRAALHAIGIYASRALKEVKQ